jgi:CDP-paratose 2-epimerase
MDILITGGAGFVGSSLSMLLRLEYPQWHVTAFDNLKRRGTELNLSHFKEIGVEFIHGDIRNRGDLEDLPRDYDIIIEASAEPSVHAGTGGRSPGYLIDTNMMGTLNCLEFGRRRSGGMIFLSTSRVYSIPVLKGLRLREAQTRFEPEENGQPYGFSGKGVTEELATVGSGFRSLYGTSKLASELFIEEYSANYNYPAVINRCGVIAGAGQFGKTDQGVFTLWVARHAFGGALSYTGFGGKGKQVRDLLHPRDLFALLKRQIERLSGFRGEVFCAGGGLEGSVSLLEYTELCRSITGNKIEISVSPGTADVDIPYFVMDYSKAENVFSWKPQMRPQDIVQDIFSWLKTNSRQLKPLLT